MKLLDYAIEGDVRSTSRIDLSQVDLEVHGFVGDREIGHSPIAKSGHFKVTFQYGEQAPAVQLRVLPAEISPSEETALTLNARVSPFRYAGGNGIRMAHQDLMLPAQYLEIVKTATRVYKMHGAVYATEFHGDDPIAIEPAPGLKIEFYLLNPPATTPGLPFRRALSLGHAYTGPDGAYQFSFKLTSKNPLKPLPPIPLPPLTRYQPKLEARIFQMIEGAWKKIYTAPVDWDGSADFQRDYFVPEEDIQSSPAPPGPPATGFQFSSIGLLPLDATRLVNGYYTSQAGDPLMVSHSPFCDALRIFGLFAVIPAVKYYKVELAATDAGGTPGDFIELHDPLANYKWNNTTHVWDKWDMIDSVSGYYKNIDAEPEADWLFHGLKFEWPTTNHTDGSYVLRITGYDATLTQVGTPHLTPMMVVDNTPPQAGLDVTSPGVGKCGGLALDAATREITFSVTAFDPAGHMNRFWLAGLRGKAAGPAGTTIEVDRPVSTSNWTGSDHGAQVFHVAARPADLLDCSQIAYNFELHVRGLATNGYSAEPMSQWASAQMNLIVSE